jgi:hypothetical protein
MLFSNIGLSPAKLLGLKFGIKPTAMLIYLWLVLEQEEQSPDALK